MERMTFEIKRLGAVTTGLRQGMNQGPEPNLIYQHGERRPVTVSDQAYTMGLWLWASDETHPLINHTFVGPDIGVAP